MKIGVVGLGSIGQRHVRNAIELGHEVKGWDIVPARRDFKLESHLYDWCDACVIATPSHFHEGPLRACIERNKHVLIEKPLSTSLGYNLSNLIADARIKKLVVMMGNNLRFHAGVKRARSQLALEAPIWANFICATPPNQNAHEGVILSTGAHEVDLALHLFGPVQYVAGASARYTGSPSPEDVADFTLVHDIGTRSTFHLDFITPDRVRQFTIAAKPENFVIDLDRRTFFLPKSGEGTFLGGSYDADYIEEMVNFVLRIEGHLSAGASGEDGLETLRVLLDVRQKAFFQ